MNERTIRVVVAALVLASSSACTVETSSPPETTSTASEPLNGLLVYTWQWRFTKDWDEKLLDLGVGTDWLCLLAGVRGNLASPNWIAMLYSDPQFPRTGVVPGHRALGIAGVRGTELSATVTCFPQSKDDTGNYVSSEDPNGSGTLVSGATSRDICGLVGFPGFGGLAHASSFIRVTNDSPSESTVFGGSRWSYKASDCYAYPRCGELASSPSKWWTYHIIAPDTGSASFVLRRNDGTLLPAGTACFLSSMHGRFRANDLADGVGVNIDFAANKWTMTATNGKSGWATCIY
jgi:hypothetical protein